MSLFFARVLGFSDAEVTVEAAVQRGQPVAGPLPFPLAFSICQVKYHVGGGLQQLQSHGDNASPDCLYGPSGAADSWRLWLAHQRPGRVRWPDQHQLR